VTSHSAPEQAASAAIIITQLATIPMALLVTRATALGRKPLLIVAFAAVPLRGLLCASFDNPSWLLGVQLLDGGGGGHGRRTPTSAARRYDARHRPLQPCSGRARHNPGNRRFDKPGRGRLHVTAFGCNAAFLTLADVAAIAPLVIVVALP
jgi:hypothetical protein